MKIRYFGTAAYEGVPALFCNCETCLKARKNGGKDLRTRSQALVNDDLLIEFNPDTVAHYQKYLFDWAKIGYCLITHSHSDHFYPADLEMLVHPGYTHDVSPVAFYAGKSAYDVMNELFTGENAVKGRATATLVAPGDLLNAGDYKVLVLAADHGPNTSPVIYAIEDKSGKRMLYAHDTGVFSDEVIEGMKRLGRFDFVSLDCTGALIKTPWVHGHMNLISDAAMKERLIEEGLADENTKFVVTHFSHNGMPIHEDLCAEAEKYSFIVGYDGLEIEF